MIKDTVLLALAGVFCFLPFILAILVLWIPNKISMRGFESSINMDGAILLQASGGSVVIKSRNFGILLAITAFVMILIGIVIGLISAFVNAIKGQPFPGLEEGITTIIVVAGLIGMIISAARSFRKKTYLFDVEYNTLGISEKGSTHHFEFNEIQSLILEFSNNERLGRFSIVLISGEKIFLGSVSGTGAKRRGEMIASAIANACGIEVVYQPVAS